jgi:predicted membrane-bound dolichyl-phosphate-mannose-protein mannosyltransferase
MSTPSASQNLPSPNGAAATASSIADDSMLRTIGIVILLGIGTMHFLQIVTTFQAIRRLHLHAVDEHAAR